MKTNWEKILKKVNEYKEYREFLNRLHDFQNSLEKTAIELDKLTRKFRVVF